MVSAIFFDFFIYLCCSAWFAHLAFSVPGEETSAEWLETVTDAEYEKLP